jgi:RNA polymerase sigma-70 factor (ECF subfamily)
MMTGKKIQPAEGRPMDEEAVRHRLSQISTAWTLLARAHAPAAGTDGAALAALVERYQAAVYRYLLAATRDPDAADELFQEFALKLLRGDFRRADAGRGRFRDFVKTALINLVLNRRKRLARTPPAVPAAEAAVAAPEPPADEEFLNGWRKALLDRAWEGLAAVPQPRGPSYHTVLRLKTDRPELSSAQLAEELTRQLQPPAPFTDANVRKVVQRARELFTDLVVEEVGRSLATGCLEEVEQELIDLGLYAYCRKALERRRPTASD